MRVRAAQRLDAVGAVGQPVGWHHAHRFGRRTGRIAARAVGTRHARLGDAVVVLDGAELDDEGEAVDARLEGHVELEVPVTRSNSLHVPSCTSPT